MKQITHRILDKEGKIIGFRVNGITTSLKTCIDEFINGIPYDLYNPISGEVSDIHVFDFDRLRANPDGSLDNNINSLPIWSEQS